MKIIITNIDTGEEEKQKFYIAQYSPEAFREDGSYVVGYDEFHREITFILERIISMSGFEEILFQE